MQHRFDGCSLHRALYWIKWNAGYNVFITRPRVRSNITNRRYLKIRVFAITLNLHDI